MKLFLPILVMSYLSTLGVAVSQRVEQIVENPNAVRLQELWRVQGNSGDEIGEGVGGVGDINGDSIDDWAVYYSGLDQWRLYYGSATGELSRDSVWSLSEVTSLPRAPLVGELWEAGEKIIGFGDYVPDDFGRRYRMLFFKVEGDSLRREPVLIYDPHVSCIKDVQAADLDGDGDDELIVSRACDFPEIWIYEGGANFQVDAPTKVVVDPDSINGGQNFYIALRDISGDALPDMITSGDYRTWIAGKPGSFFKTKVYFSSSTSPWFWDQAERVIEGAKLTDDTVGVPITPSPLKSVLHDGDGDGIIDMIGTIQVGPESRRGSYLWLSGSGKSARTRSYDSTDWDVYLPSTENGYIIGESSLGYVADSSNRWSSLPLHKGLDGSLYLLGSGRNGPNGTIDAVAGDARESMFNTGGPVGDVNGDGWEDVIFGNFNYRSRGGIAVIFAGGPYIPNDDPTVSVREVGIAGEGGGLYVWPNPVEEELHLGWKGNLVRMPVRFVVYDVLGRPVAEEDVATWNGAHLWKCDALPAGVYILTIVDKSGSVIGVTRIVKE